MRAAAHTPGGFGGVPQKVGKDFAAADAKLGSNSKLRSPKPGNAKSSNSKLKGNVTQKVKAKAKAKGMKVGRKAFAQASAEKAASNLTGGFARTQARQKVVKGAMTRLGIGK